MRHERVVAKQIRPGAIEAKAVDVSSAFGTNWRACRARADRKTVASSEANLPSLETAIVRIERVTNALLPRPSADRPGSIGGKQTLVGLASVRWITALSRLFAEVTRTRARVRDTLACVSTSQRAAVEVRAAPIPNERTNDRATPQIGIAGSAIAAPLVWCIARRSVGHAAATLLAADRNSERDLAAITVLVAALAYPGADGRSVAANADGPAVLQAIGARDVLHERVDLDRVTLERVADSIRAAPVQAIALHAQITNLIGDVDRLG